MNQNPIISITGDTSIIQGQQVSLIVSGGSSYNWLNTLALSCSTCDTTIASPISNTIYCVEVTTSQGCVDTACVAIDIQSDCSEMFIPTGFSPNKDGKNDVFQVRMHENCVTEFQLMIFNRLGEKVFESTDINNPWNGTFKGELLNDAVFIYFLTMSVSSSSEKIVKKGNITLIK